MGYQPIPPHGPLWLDLEEADLPALDVPIRYVVLVLLAAPVATLALQVVPGVDAGTHARLSFLPGAVLSYLLLWGVLRSLRRRGVALADLGLSTAAWRRELAIGIVVGLGLAVVVLVAAWLVGRFLPFAPGLAGGLPAWSRWGYSIALLVAIAPAGEVVWRGFAIATLWGRIGLAPAVTVSAAAFGAQYWWGGPALVVTTALLGLLLAVLYAWRGRLLAPIVGHVFAGLALVWA